MTYFLTRNNMNINLALVGDVEDTNYRYQVFPGYRTWVHQNMHLSNKNRKEVFTPVKDRAIALIMAVREEATQKQVTTNISGNTVTIKVELLDRVRKRAEDKVRAELEARIAELKTEVKSVQSKLTREEKLHNKTKAQRDELKISLRQALRNNVVTKHAASIAGKVAKVATTKVVINIGK